MSRGRLNGAFTFTATVPGAVLDLEESTIRFQRFQVPFWDRSTERSMVNL